MGYNLLDITMSGRFFLPITSTTASIIAMPLINSILPAPIFRHWLRLKSALTDPSAMKWYFYFISLIAIAWPSIFLDMELFGYFYPRKTIVNAAVISIPFFFLPKKWKGLVLIPIWALVVFFITNIMSLRFTQDMILLPNYFLFDNFNSVLFDSALVLFKPKDLWILLMPAVATISYFCFFRYQLGSKGFNAGLSAAISILFVSVLGFYEFRSLQAHAERTNRSLLQAANNRYLEVYTHLSVHDYYSSDLCCYILKNIISRSYQALRSHELDAEETAFVNSFMVKHNHLADLPPTQQFVSNQKKSVIFIIVESLNSWIINYSIGNKEICPVLNSCIQDSSAVSALSIVPQIKAGISSDGHFLFTTGMLPSSQATTACAYGDNEFYSLPKIIGKTSFEAICETPVIWNHLATNKSYGYNLLFPNLGNDPNLHTSKDQAVFERGVSICDSISKPFYGFITSLSMHAPFQDPNVKRPDWINSAPGLTEQMKDYLTVTNAFDTALGYFLTELKKRNLYDNSIILIASDHSAPVEGAPVSTSYTPITFIALNTGMHYEHKGTIGQVDVFPTILEITGHLNDSKYKGMGFSIFNKPAAEALDLYHNGKPCDPQFKEVFDSGQRAANLMLRSDWHRTHPMH